MSGDSGDFVLTPGLLVSEVLPVPILRGRLYQEVKKVWYRWKVSRSVFSKGRLTSDTTESSNPPPVPLHLLEDFQSLSNDNKATGTFLWMKVKGLPAGIMVLSPRALQVEQTLVGSKFLSSG